MMMLNLVLLPSCSANDSGKSQELAIQSDIFQPVVDTLLTMGVDSTFIKKYITSKNLEFSDRFVKVNVTGYLSKTDYSSTTSSATIKKSLEFLSDNLSTLQQAETTYGVPKEIIVAILWVETKFGQYLGNNHLPSVFFSTALVSAEKYIAVNDKVIDDYTDNDSLKAALKQKVRQRSNTKAKWAINELVAMADIEKTNSIDFDNIKGSWAGAFGISQFLPSSYKRAAVDGNNDGKIDLFNLEDAIPSVGNYLKNSKWDNFENKKKAVFYYNNSNDYAEQIVRLSEILAKKQKK